MSYDGKVRYIWYSYKWAVERNGGRASYFIDESTKQPIIGTHQTDTKEPPTIGMQSYDDLMFVGSSKFIVGPCLDPPYIDTSLFKRVMNTSDGKVKRVTEFFTDEDMRIE